MQGAFGGKSHRLVGAVSDHFDSHLQAVIRLRASPGMTASIASRITPQRSGRLRAAAFPEDGRYPGEGQLIRIEIWPVRRREMYYCFRGSDDLADCTRLLRRQILDDDNFAGLTVGTRTCPT